MPIPRRGVLAFVSVGVIASLSIALLGAYVGEAGSGSVAPREPGCKVPPPPLRWQGPVPPDWPRVPDGVHAASGTLISSQWAWCRKGAAQVTRSGWPLRALRSTLVYGRGQSEPEVEAQRNRRAGIPLDEDKITLTVTFDIQANPARPSGETSRTTHAPRRLPLDPLWAGIAGNTAFYGTLAFLLWSAPGSAKRSCRRRHGRCLACGYDLQGLAKCPECGAS